MLNRWPKEVNKMDLDLRTVERVRAEFVAKEMEASGYTDYRHGCDTCGDSGLEGHAFTLEDVNKILDGLLSDQSRPAKAKGAGNKLPT
jgi:hypothetical protein